MNRRFNIVALVVAAVMLAPTILFLPKSAASTSNQKAFAVTGNNLPSNALAASRPVVHWSTFEKRASQCACHLISLSALREEGLNQIFEDTGSIILAGNDSVVAEVVCLPNNRQVRLSAFSSDSRTAELTRNRVRETIVKRVLYDSCP